MPFLTQNVKLPANLVIDADDVLWPFNETVCKKTGIPYEKIICFQTKENPLLSDDEKQRILAVYNDESSHAEMPMYPGARAFGKLAADPRISAWICSNSVSDAVIRDKKRNLSEFFAEDWKNFQTMFNLINMSDAHVKRFPPDIWCLIDDSPHNAIASGARHILMPEKPWNTSAIGVKTMWNAMDRVIYYSCIAEAIDLLTKLMLKDLGPRME